MTPASASRAAHLARLRLTYGPRWHITASPPAASPRTLTAVNIATGQHIHARGEHDLETQLTHTAQPSPPTGRGHPRR